MVEAVFKMLRQDEAAAAADDDSFHGTALDRQDGFIHLSYKAQVAETLARHFGESDEVLLLRVDPRLLAPGSLRAERSRGGALFPHLYGPLPWGAVTARFTLRRGADGAFLIPDSIDADLV